METTNEFKTFDLTAEVNHQVETDQHSLLRGFGGAVAIEVKKCSIATKLETRDHSFDDGAGKVAMRLTVVIDFNDATVQPHDDFGSDFAEFCVDALAQNVNGNFENQD